MSDERLAVDPPALQAVSIMSERVSPARDRYEVRNVVALDAEDIRRLRELGVNVRVVIPYRKSKRSPDAAR